MLLVGGEVEWAGKGLGCEVCRLSCPVVPAAWGGSQEQPRSFASAVMEKQVRTEQGHCSGSTGDRTRQVLKEKTLPRNSL